MSLVKTTAGTRLSSPDPGQGVAPSHPVGVPVRVTAAECCGPLVLRKGPLPRLVGVESLCWTPSHRGCVCCEHQAQGRLQTRTTPQSSVLQPPARRTGAVRPRPGAGGASGSVCCSTLPCNCLFICISPLGELPRGRAGPVCPFLLSLV